MGLVEYKFLFCSTSKTSKSRGSSLTQSYSRYGKRTRILNNRSS